MVDRELLRGTAERARVRDGLHVAKVVPGEHWSTRALPCLHPRKQLMPALAAVFAKCKGVSRTEGAARTCRTLRVAATRTSAAVLPDGSWRTAASGTAARYRPARCQGRSARARATCRSVPPCRAGTPCRR